MRSFAGYVTGKQCWQAAFPKKMAAHYPKQFGLFFLWIPLL